MSRKFLTPIDLAKNELQNAVVQNLAAAPSSPAKGQLYFDTTVTPNVLYWWDGAVWQPAKGSAPAYGAVAPEPTFGSAAADGAATTVSRSDHKHGNPVHDNAAHSAINLNALAAPTAAVSMNGQLLTNLAAPVSGTDGANKTYVDNLTTGMAWKNPVRAATTANITLSGTQTIDGVAVVAGDRVLVKNQTNAAENGIYLVAAGAWTRAPDADAPNEMGNAAVFVQSGTTQADTAWVCTADPPVTIGTTALPFVQFAGGGAVVGGAGLTQVGNTLNVGAGFGITVAADTVAVDTAVIATDGEVATALTGKANTTTTVTAGNGLTGGGDLSANRTFDIGAGTGITVAADSVALDTTYTDARYAAAANAAKRYAVDVGGATSVVVTHNLGTKDCIVQVYRVGSPFDQVECDVEHTSTTTVTLRFTVAPAAAEYRCVVLA